MIKFYIITCLLLAFYFWMGRVEKKLTEEKEREEQKKMEKEKLLTEFYW